MAIESLGDIADVPVTTATTLTWGTATDWDNAVDEAGVVHETRGDLPGADVIQLGYPSFDRGGSALRAYYDMDEVVSGAVPDRSGNDLDATNNGTTSAPGNHNTTLRDGDGTNDYLEPPNAFNNANTTTLSSTLSVSMWIEIDRFGNGSGVQGQLLNSGTTDPFNVETEGASDLVARVYEGNSKTNYRARWTNATTGTLYHVVARFTTSIVDLWVDATQRDSTAHSNTFDFQQSGGSTPTLFNFSDATTDRFFDGRIEDFRLYDRELSSTEIQALYDAGTGGQLETATKSFASAQQPDLQNLVYTLNGQTINLDVIGSPGTASEEVVTQTLDGATSYTLSWTDTHTDFRLKLRFSTTTPDDSPEFSQGELA